MPRPKVEDPAISISLRLRRSVLQEVMRRADARKVSPAAYLKSVIEKSFGPKEDG